MSIFVNADPLDHTGEPAISAPASSALRMPAAEPLALSIVMAFVYINSFWGVFVFDEFSGIVTNEGIRHFWPPDWMLAYPNASRPFVNFTFMLNYLMGGNHFFPYHLFNFFIHLSAGLTLYGIAWRTLRLCMGGPVGTLLSKYAEVLGFSIALLWTVHPLQTSAVTYVIQRCESLMGLCLLLTLYAVIRCATDPRVPFRERRDSRVWAVIAVLACAAGMGSKQVMAAAPLLILLYDRAFLSGTFARAWQARRNLYIGLFATLAILTLCILSDEGIRQSAGFGIKKVSSWHYLLTQCRVIPEYLRLTFWPDSLSVDHDWPLNYALSEVWLPGLCIAAALAATFYGVVRNRRWTFLPAWFFLILAPTSSFMPINDPMFEHRMYLPLAAVIAAVLIGAVAIVAKWKEPAVEGLKLRTPILFACCLLSLPLSARTVLRNQDYADDVRIWKMAADRYPNTARIANNLGNALAFQGRHEEAVRYFENAVRVNPNYDDPLFNLGVENNMLNRKDEAAAYYERLLRLKPDYLNAHFNLGWILKEQKRYAEAAPHFAAELKRDPKRVDAREALEEMEDAIEAGD